MSKTNAFETGIQQVVFQNVVSHATIAALGSGLQASATPGSLHVSLHTGDPGETGSQTTNEATYTSYARVAVARSAAGWAVTNDTADNVAAVTFPQATGGSNTITHFGIGTAASGAGNLLYKGALTQSLAVSSGITPEFGIGDCNVTED